jgi:glucose/mannose-6-phosphate isomerase
LSLLNKTINTGSTIAAVTSGGTMSKLCERYKIPMIKLRPGLQPRAALPLLFPALTQILSAFNIIEEMHSEIKETAEELRIQAQKISPSVKLNVNPSKKLAVKLLDSVPSIYSLERMSSVARRMKDQLNENSKILAKFDLIPEACHNEIEGTLGKKKLGQSHLKFPLIFIRDQKELPDEKIRIETFQKRFRKIDFGPIHEIRTNAIGNLSRILLPINFGDFVSAYLAIAKGVDPTPVYFIDEFKKIIKGGTNTKKYG